MRTSAAFLTLVLASALAGCGKKEPPRDVAAEVDAHWASFKPALAAFRAGYGTDCKISRIKAFSGWSAHDADALDAVLAGRAGEDRLGLYSSLIALKPGALLDERERGRAARALDEYKNGLDGGATMIYRVSEMNLPSLGLDQAGQASKQFIGGSVKVEAMFLDPKTAEPLCLVAVEARSSDRLLVPQETEAARRAIGADLMKNARAELELRTRPFR